MKKDISTQAPAIESVAELKRLILAGAIATGNTYAFHELFSRARETSTAPESERLDSLLSSLSYLLPDEKIIGSPKFAAAVDLIDRAGLREDSIPAAFLEEAAKEAAARGKFAYAEDAYKLLGIKNEMVALYAQTGEQFLRDGKPKQAAMAFLVAASIDQPIGPHYQYLGPELHSRCPIEPKQCVTELQIETLVDEGIRFLLGHDTLAQRLLAQADAGQRRHMLGALAAYRDTDLSEAVKNLRASVAALLRIENGKPDDYSAIGSVLLGRTTSSGQYWQYLKELCFEHPIASLCVCLRPIRNSIALVPAIRDDKPLIDLLLPPDYLKA